MEYMASEGIELNQPEIPGKDLYTESCKQLLRSYKTPSSFDKLKQFPDLDRKVLRFYCVWDDRDRHVKRNEALYYSLLPGRWHCEDKRSTRH